MSCEIFHVDAFASQPFAGNPAAVCLLSEPVDESWMQSVAAEMNLSETAFVLAEDGDLNLRWFTPRVEVALCGHATLASAHALWESNRVSARTEIEFQTRSGPLVCGRENDWIGMDFPSLPPTACDAPPGLLDALGTPARYVGRSRMDYLVEVEDERQLRSLKPRFAALAAVNVRGIIVTAESAEPNYDFVSRFFAPAVGVDEDPVTGSAHCCLAPYWGEKLGRQELTGYQASSRGGVVRVRQAGSRVALIGQAVTVTRGTMAISAARLEAAASP